MNILVLLAGIADPKWPLKFPPDLSSASANDTAPPRILSPFDEAALEVALKLRDEQPQTRIAAGVLNSQQGEPLLRTVAALRPNDIFGVDSKSLEQWDARLLSSQLGLIVRERADPVHLMLAGREMGDRDDGTLAACVAEQLAWRFVGLVQRIEATHDTLRLMRERSSVEEWIELAPPLVASVTNDRRNRLRHPLMKNVMAAQRGSVPVMSAPAANETAILLRKNVESLTPPVRKCACRFLAGAPAAQAAELAAFLQARRPNS